MLKTLFKNRARLAFFKDYEIKVLILIILTAMITAAAVFSVTIIQYGNAAIHSIRTQLESIGPQIIENLSRRPFLEFAHSDDAQTTLYQDQNEYLDKIRAVSSLKQLYTVKRNAAGALIYLIDGRSPDTPGFASIGALVEEVSLAEIERAMNGETVLVLKEDAASSVYIGHFPVRGTDGGVIGVMGLEYDVAHLLKFNRMALFYSLFITLILTLAMCLAFVFLYKKVSVPFHRKLAYTDVLTGLHNRTAFEMDIRKIQPEQSENGREVIAVFDLNNLKLVNDTFGHRWGDEYLKCAANIIQGLFIRDGESYRIGGDEFALICTEANPAEIGDKLDTGFVEAVDDIRKSDKSGSPSSYFSIAYGMAFFDSAKHQTLHNVFDEADQSMYRMKKKMKEGPASKT